MSGCGGCVATNITPLPNVECFKPDNSGLITKTNLITALSSIESENNCRSACLMEPDCEFSSWVPNKSPKKNKILTLTLDPEIV